MNISGMGSAYTDYISNQMKDSSDKVTTKLNQTDFSNASDEELMEACKGFESYFLEQVFDKMLDTTKLFSDEEENTYASKMVDYFKDGAIQKLTEQATSQSGLGIAQTLFDQMKRQYSAIKPEELEKKGITSA